MKLQILIPQYKETDEVIKPLLDSVALQQNINMDEVGIIIVNDGTDVQLSADLLGSYPFAVEYHLMEHGGVSAARNACLEHASADYVMFCDADDLFCDVCGLYIIFREMEVGFDALISAFREETRSKDKKPIYINHGLDTTFVHGKVYRRQYLIDSAIRFNPSLTIHEDSFFNILARSMTQSAKFCSTPFYLWKWRDDSVCRHDPDYILKTYSNMIDSNDALVCEFLRRGRADLARFYTGYMVMDAYYTMNKPAWLDKTHGDYRAAVESRFRRYYDKHKYLYEGLTEQERMAISNAIRQRAVGEGMLMEALTLDQWLDQLIGGIQYVQ